MVNVLHEEIKISNNYFLISYEERKEKKYIVRCFPFAIFEIDYETYEEILSGTKNDDNIEAICKELGIEGNENNAFTTPGIFYQPIMIITNSCNLQCKYCFADEGSYGLKENCRMEHKVIKGTVDYVFKRMGENAENITGKSIEIAFVAFGGEALLNIEAIHYLIEYAKEQCDLASSKFSANITPLIIINTNGILISEEILNEFSVYKKYIEFVVSFDGLYHDKNRIFRNGEGSKELTIRGINLLKEHNYKFYITCCLIPEELNRVRENIEYISKIVGPDILINLSFIRGAISTLQSRVAYPGILQQQYTDEMVEHFTEQIVAMIKDGYNIYADKFMRKVYAGGFMNKCAACLYEFCVISSGEAYPCHNFINKEYCLGNVLDEESFSITDHEQYKKFIDRNVNDLDPCKDCYLKTVCISSFDCPSHSEFDLGDFKKVDMLTCKAGKNIQSALIEKYFLQ